MDFYKKAAFIFILIILGIIICTKSLEPIIEATQCICRQKNFKKLNKELVKWQKIYLKKRIFEDISFYL